MVSYFDTHCHLTCGHFADDRSEVINTAADQGCLMLTVGTDLQTSLQAVKLAENNCNVYAAIGIHPNDVNDKEEMFYNRLAEIAVGDKVVAIGETGLDFYRDRVSQDDQIKALEKHVALAEEYQLPLILHARQSIQTVLDTIEPFIASGGKAVWHCLSESKKKLAPSLKRSLELGIYFGLGGLITYEDQAPLRAIVPTIPDRYLLLETDSPFIIPRPRTVERNEPVQVLRVAEELALLRGVTSADIARITTRNACRLLGLPLPGEEGKVAYVIRDSLYIALTNSCTNNCSFCARNDTFEVKGHDIHLDHDPSVKEVLSAMGDFSTYNEVVFCGFGEPTMRLGVLLEVAATVKATGQTVRLNTNGLANLYHQRDIVPELTKVIDEVSVSFNTSDPDQYTRLCRPDFSDRAFAGMCDFVKLCVASGLRTVCTVVDMPEIDVRAAEKKVAELGAEFRIRNFVDVG